jgi:WD40 repeat protein
MISTGTVLVGQAQEPSAIPIINQPDLENLTLLSTIAFDSRVNGLAWSSDGSMLAVSSPRGVRLFAMPSFDSSTEVSNLPAFDVDIQPNGHLIAFPTRGNKVIVKDMQSGLETVLEHDAVTTVLFNQTGTLLASASGAGTILVWNTQTWLHQPLFSGGEDNAVIDLSFQSDNALLASVHQRGDVFFWNLRDLRNGNSMRTFTSNDETLSVSFAFRPGSDNFAKLTLDSPIAVSTSLEVANLAQVNRGIEVSESRSLESQYAISDLVYSPDGSLIITIGGDQLIFSDARTLQILAVRAIVSSNARLLSINSQGNLLAIAAGVTGNNTIEIWGL